MSLVLKSNKPYTGDLFEMYKYRVLSDGGRIMDEAAARDALAFFNSKNLNGEKLLSATASEWGVKLVDGRMKKLYSLFGERGDVETKDGYPSLYFTMVDGKYLFSSSGLLGRVVLSKGEYAVSNIAMFATVSEGSNVTSTKYDPVLHFQNVGGGNDGVGVYYSHLEKSYLIKTLDDYYRIESIPFRGNIGMSLSDNLVAYQDGLAVGTVPAEKLSGNAYKFSLVSTVDNSMGGSQTGLFAAIVATSLEDSEAKVLSGYVANYLAV